MFHKGVGLSMDMGMNLQKVAMSEDVSRMDRLREVEKKKMGQPYNRSFVANGDEMSRTGNRERKRQNRFTFGFSSWVLGLFSGLLMVLFAWAIIIGFEPKSNATDASINEPMIVQSAESNNSTNTTGSDEVTSADTDDVDWDEVESSNVLDIDLSNVGSE